MLLGGTGQGKTSLLESLYIGCTTRSFRTSRLADCLAFDAAERGEGLSTSVEIDTGARARLEVTWSTADGLGRSVNGERSSLAEHVGRQPILAWSAADSDVLIGAPEARRRLVDRIGVSVRPTALDLLGTYRKTLEHKRALLQQRADAVALRSFQTLMIRAAEDLVAFRRLTVQRLRAALREVLGELQGRVFDIELCYRSSPDFASGERLAGNDLGPESEARERVVLENGWSEPAFERRLENERGMRRPLIGPHRDRIDILYRGRPVAETASAGERKAIGLILVAAQSRVLTTAGRPPVLLIDDIDTEMDQITLERVWPLLSGAPQTLVSSNREGVFENLEIPQVWSVRNGSVANR